MPKEVIYSGDEVVALTQKYLSKEDVAFVHKALVYAVECHSGQYRKSGEPYIIHPIQVAIKCSDRLISQSFSEVQHVRHRYFHGNYFHR